ncbi:MAG: hypothetical protein IKG55_02710 [Solobacterium sp.]|nr:hypothetical protein [Solobacterium sp.]
MLKSYLWRDVEWQFEEGKQPEGAVELKPEKKKAAEPLNKVVKPANKVRKAAKK